MKPVLYSAHPEAVSVDEFKGFQPWRVTLPIQTSMFDQDKFDEAVYYVRAPKPGLATAFADKLWTKYEKIDKGLVDAMGRPSAWPDVVGNLEIDVLDENDWQEFWAEARRHPHRFEGEDRNPLAFTFWKEKKESLIFIPN